MLDCTDIKALLSAIVDDQLDGETRHDVERHFSGCEGCRALISRAESLDSLIAAEANTALSGSMITPEFEGAVLAQTVYAKPIGRVGNRAITFGGWFAAAASIALASAIWFFDQPGPVESHESQLIAIKPAASNRNVPAGLRRSFVTTDPQPREMFRRPAARATTVSLSTPTGADHSNGRAIQRPEPATMLAASDRDTLANAALVLEMLKDADTSSFADVEQVRRIVVYDDLLPRLERTRSRLSDEEKFTLSVATRLISRAVNGPVSIDDVKAMRDDISDLKLTQQIEDIGSRASHSFSL